MAIVAIILPCFFFLLVGKIVNDTYLAHNTIPASIRFWMHSILRNRTLWIQCDKYSSNLMELTRYHHMKWKENRYTIRNLWDTIPCSMCVDTLSTHTVECSSMIFAVVFVWWVSIHCTSMNWLCVLPYCIGNKTATATAATTVAVALMTVALNYLCKTIFSFHICLCVRCTVHLSMNVCVWHDDSYIFFKIHSHTHTCAPFHICLCGKIQVCALFITKLNAKRCFN